MLKCVKSFLSTALLRVKSFLTTALVYVMVYTFPISRSVGTINGISPTWLGAGHGEDLRFVFGYSFIPGLSEFRGPMTAEEDELSVKVIRFWTNFARTG